MKNKILVIFLCLIFTITQAIAREKIEYTNPEIGVLVFKIDTKKYGNKIKPYMAKNLMTSQKVYDDNCYDLVVNGGFFDVKTGNSVSFVKIDNQILAEVDDNIKLVESLKQQNRYENVLNRAEFRILETKRGKLKFDIAYHNSKISKRYRLKHALQAGPMINPTMDLVKEGFVIKEDDVVKFQSADILKRRERTAIGLKGKYLYVVVFTHDHRVDAIELKNYMSKKLKIKKAMAFDGGLSTSLNYKCAKVGSLGKYQRRVKSFLVVER